MEVLTEEPGAAVEPQMGPLLSEPPGRAGKAHDPWQAPLPAETRVAVERPQKIQKLHTCHPGRVLGEQVPGGH